MGMETESTSLLKVVYDVLGRRSTKVVVWVALVGAVIWLAPTTLDRFEALIQKFGSEATSWGDIQGFIVALFLLVVFVLVVYGFLFLGLGLMARISGIGIYRREIREIKADITEIKERLSAMEVAMRMDASGDDD